MDFQFARLTGEEPSSELELQGSWEDSAGEDANFILALTDLTAILTVPSCLNAARTVQWCCTRREPRGGQCSLQGQITHSNNGAAVVSHNNAGKVSEMR